jgi:hypothetical protein
MRTLHDFYIQVLKSSVRADFPLDGSELIGSKSLLRKGRLFGNLASDGARVSQAMARSTLGSPTNQLKVPIFIQGSLLP